MIEQIKTSSSALTAATSLSTASLVKTAASSRGTNKDSATSSEISPAYSVEISNEGMKLSAAATADAASTTSTTSSATNSNTATTGTAAATATSSSGAAQKTTAPSASATSSSDSSTSEDLSQYTAAQLQALLNEGKITQSEYSSEVAKRNEEKQKTEMSSSGSVAADTQ